MKIKGLKKAIGDYKRVNAGGYYDPHYGFLMYDKSTGEIWTSEFYDFGHNSYIAYNDPDIVNLGRMMNENEIEINMANTKKFIAENF